MKMLCLFLSISLGVVFSETIFIEAEAMTTDGNTWMAIDNFAGWYHGVPSGAKMLRGSKDGQGTATKSLDIKMPGQYRVWIRYLDVLKLRGRFKMQVRQDDETFDLLLDEASVRSAAAGTKKWGKGFAQFVWASKEVSLKKGKASLTLVKAEPIRVSWITRHVDCFVVTSDLDYIPRITDFEKPLYLRVTMGDQHVEPCFIHLFGRRPRSPWYMKHHNLTQAGLHVNPYGGISGKHAKDPARLLSPNESSPWVNIVGLLDTIGFNRLMLTAIRSYNDRLDSVHFTAWLSSTPSEEGLLKKAERKGSGADLGLMIDLTDRENIRSDREWCVEAWEQARKLPDVPGRRPQIFPVQTSCSIPPDVYTREIVKMETEILHQLGFSGLKIGQLEGTKDFNRPAGLRFYFHLKNNGCFNQPRVDAIKKALAAYVKNIRELKLQDRLTHIGLMDEPGGPSLEHLTGCSTCRSKFSEFVQSKGFTLDDLGKQNWQQVFPSQNRLDGLLYYLTIRFRHQTLADFFKIGTDFVRGELPMVRTTSNFAESLTFNGNLLKRGVDWFLIQEQEALTRGWTEDWLAYSTSFQLCGYRADFLRAACRLKQQPFGMYNIVKGRTTREIKLKAVTSIGHGASAIFHFNYGPYYSPTSDQISHQFEKYPAVREVNYAIGGAEKYLVGAKPARSKIAFLYSHTSDIWTLNDAHSLQGNERMGLYLLLRHLGYPVEVVTEDDVVEDRISDLEFLILCGSHLRRDALLPLKAWIKAGGHFYLGAGSLRFDERNKPYGYDRDFAIKRGEYEFHEACGRAQYEFPKLKVLEKVKFSGSELESVCALQRTSNTDTEQLAQFSDGSSALIRRPMGEGSLLASGFFPGISYCRAAAVNRKNWWAELEKEAKKAPFYSSHSYPAAYRKLFRALLSDVEYQPECTASRHLVEANLLYGEKGLVVALANWSAGGLKDVEIRVKTERKLQQPYAIRNPLKNVIRGADGVKLSLDIDAIDFILLPFE